VFAETPGPDGRPRRACVIRHVNPAEARIVRRLFEEYVAGRGLTRPAKGLDVQHVPPPRAPGRGWAPTAIREILRRDLYRGVIQADGTYAALLAGRRVVNDGGVPEGIGSAWIQEFRGVLEAA
jgi:hypothetical protein